VDFLEQLGIGIAIGMLAGTTGTHGSARGRMTLLAAVIGLVAGFLLDGALGALCGLVGAAVACLVISDLVFGASRREKGSGSGALGFIVVLAALIVVAISLLVPILVILVIIALAWLGISRHRRAQRKHAGLRVLR
jgi:uncharacterized membrane protein YjgN (DUF898 family)